MLVDQGFSKRGHIPKLRIPAILHVGVILKKKNLVAKTGGGGGNLLLIYFDVL
jgi:hypothetical protein